MIAFGERLQTLPRLDAFIANAAIDVAQYKLVEAHESNMTINIISTFLSALLAIPVLTQSSKQLQRPTRLVITGTVGHIFCDHTQLTRPQKGQIFQVLDDEATANMADRYHISKLVVLRAMR